MKTIRTLKASRIAEDLHSYLVEKRYLKMRVHSVFQTSVNLVTPEDDLITMVTASRDIMPMGLTLDVGEPFEWPFLVDDSVEYTGFPMLTVPSCQCRIELQDAKRWTPYLQNVKYGSAKARLQALKQLKTIVAKHDSLGIASLVSVLDTWEDVSVADCDNVYCRFILHDMVLFLRAVKRQDWHTAGRQVMMLIGFGPGLTPSCDDFMSAVLLSLYYDENVGSTQQKERSAFIEHVVSAAKKQTTLVSASMIQHAAEGKASGLYLSVLGALLGGDTNALVDAATSALQFGASSGSDFLFGLCAMQQLMETWRNSN
ncbi:MAG: DUF2877 domain-containing protein [Clostridiaceae bacterium]|nr:DUF2877 domain-containing protein [Clostridiaceae bacterium]